MEDGSDLHLESPMGVIPAGTLLKTEFSACLPTAGDQEKNSVSVHTNS